MRGLYVSDNGNEKLQTSSAQVSWSANVALFVEKVLDAAYKLAVVFCF